MIVYGFEVNSIECEYKLNECKLYPDSGHKWMQINYYYCGNGVHENNKETYPVSPEKKS